MKKSTKLIATFVADYKKSMNHYGIARLTIYEELMHSKDEDLRNNYIEYQHGSPANSPR